VTIKAGDRRSPVTYAPPKVSWEDFLHWVLGIEGRAEWVDGEIIELMPESLRSYLLIRLLSDLFRHEAEGHRLGLVLTMTFLMRLPDRPSGRVPDLMFVAREHLGRLTNTYLDGPADLVVEVVSPDSEKRDRRGKLIDYQDAGIPEYWLIDAPRNEAHFYVLGPDGKYQAVAIGEDGVYTSAVLPGVRLKVEWLWRDPLPTLDEALAELG
jgi:Uma2 family endonuclease